MNAIRAGACDAALVVGAEKMIYPDVDKETVFRTFLGGTDIHRIGEARALFRRLSGELESGATSEGGTHTFFMDMYAALARQHMRRFGTTERQIAAAAAKNHGHSVHNPLSQYTHAMSIDDVLADKAIAYPLTRAMCAPVSDGAAAAVVVGDAWLRRRAGGARRGAVSVRSCVLRAGRPDRDPDDYDAHVGELAAREAYEAAAVAARRRLVRRGARRHRLRRDHAGREPRHRRPRRRRGGDRDAARRRSAAAARSTRRAGS